MARTIKSRQATEAGKVLAALAFVQKEVRYLGIAMGAGSHRPNPPESTLNRRFGDCKDKSVLLCALLRELGIKAHPALVHTQYGSRLTDWLPSPLAFDHVIAWVELSDGRQHWLDGTALYQAGDLLQHAATDFGSALILRPGESELTRMTRPEAARARVL